MVQSLLFTDEDIQSTGRYRRLGLLNGLMIGLLLAAGIWGSPLLYLAGLPLPLRYVSLIMQMAVTVIACAVTGWLTARLARTGITLLVWFLCAVLIALSLVHLPDRLRTLAVWLADSRFWGLPIYPAPEVRAALPFIVGFFMILILMALAFLQDYRLEGIYRSLGENDRMRLSTWARLLLPAPVLLIIGYITADMIGINYTWWAAQQVHLAIQRVNNYDGDLFQLSLAEGLNYNALRGVRTLLTPQYTLNIAEVSEEGTTTIITAYFDNDAWINCQFIGDNLINCFDAAPPYTSGLSGIIQGVPLPDPADCRNCFPRIDEQWIDWLHARHDRLGDTPHISRLAQWGSHVLMRAEGETADFAVECLFSGAIPVRLDNCQEVEN